ncbi:hypothetical protein niasHT_008267 [Heterodera trifolii]|uniref:CCHC-type domain-containing protein n=1 Tax=Heterodera trifolii TaxID=157864 RepID=A0ABD2M3F5_9BILA
MPKNQKSKRFSKKSSSASAALSSPPALLDISALPNPAYEDISSPEGSVITGAVVANTIESTIEPNLDNAVLTTLSPEDIDRIFADDPGMAEEVGRTDRGSEIGPQIKSMLDNSAFGPSVMNEISALGTNESTFEEIAVSSGALETMGAMISLLSVQGEEERLIERAIEVIEETQKMKGSFGQMIMKEMENEGEKCGEETNTDLGPSVMDVVESEQSQGVNYVLEVDQDGIEVFKEKNPLGKRRRNPSESENVKEEEKEGDDGGSGRKMIICQITDKMATAIRFGGKMKGPDIIGIPESFELGVQLKLGDIVFVTSYAPIERFPVWLSNAFRINADAEAMTVSSVLQNSLENCIGIVMSMVREQKDVPKAVDVAFPESQVLQRLYQHQMDSKIDLAKIKPGVLINVTFARIHRPSDIAIGPKGIYIAPADFEGVSERELVVHQPCIGTGISGFVNGYEFPFSTSTDLKLCEHGIAAAVSGALLKAKAEMEEFTIHTGLFVLESGKDNMVVTFEHFVQEKRKFVNLTKIWEIDAAVLAKLKGAKKPCAVGRILDVHKCVVQEMFVLQAKVLLMFQLARKYDAEGDFDRLAEGHEASITPSESFQALELRVERFYGHVFSCMSSGSDETSRIWKILLAQNDVQSEGTSSEVLARIERHPALWKLEGGQIRTAELMLDNVPRVVAQQAPPGSGKTYTLAAIVAALMSDPKNKILCLAPLNVAVVKMCEELVGALQTEGCDEVPLALFSGNGKGKYRDYLDKIAGNLLESVVTSEDFWKKLKQKEKGEVHRYLRDVRKRPRIAKEALIAEYVLNLDRRRVLCCTLGFAEQIGRLLCERNIVVLDEAGQGPFVQVCSTLSALCEIKKVLVTGDRYQLAVNMQSVPEPVRVGFGFDTILINLDKAKAVDRTTLLTNYRSHWQIVACVEHMAYKPHGERLQPGPGSFRMLIDFWKMPVADSPLLLIHQETLMEPEMTSFSATNSGQTRTVLDLLALLDGFPGSIRIISFYAGQAAQIGTELKEQGFSRSIVSATADAMQGHEADITIVTTTVSRQQRFSNWQRANFSKDRKSEFWGDAQRVNVALSRGKHGLIVIGDFLELGSSPIWSRFLNKAIEFTVVTSPSVVKSIKSPRSSYVRGLLVDDSGESVQNYRFHADWLAPGRSSSTAAVPSRNGRPLNNLNRPNNLNFQNSPISQTRDISNPPLPSRHVQREFSRTRAEIRCWRCNQPGHVSTRCTNPPARQN